MTSRITFSALAICAAAGMASVTVNAQEHIMTKPGDVEWQAAPASVPEGAEAAVLYGNPGEDGQFALRLRFPAGYELPPHTHAKPEIVTVISGTFHLGMGEAADRDATDAMEAGSFFAFQPGLAHFAYTDEETVVQINSIGPWGIEYVDPSDDPRGTN